MKFVVLIGVLLVAWLVWRSRRSGPGRSGGPATGTATAPDRAPQPAQDMIRCETCGLHLPRADALADARGRLFCGSEHRDAAG